MTNIVSEGIDVYMNNALKNELLEYYRVILYDTDMFDEVILEISLCYNNHFLKTISKIADRRTILYKISNDIGISETMYRQSRKAQELYDTYMDCMV